MLKYILTKQIVNVKINNTKRGIDVEKIKIIGHRGNIMVSTENSVSAILDCSRNPNIDGTEFDIRPTSDDKIVVIHNDSIPNLNGKMTKIYDLTLDEINHLKFRINLTDQLLLKGFHLLKEDRYYYNRYCEISRQNSNIATFDEIMKNYSPKKHMLIELKGKVNEYTPKKQAIFEDNIIEILKQNDYQNRDLTLESYNFDALFRIKNKLPDLKIVALVNKFGNLECLDMPFDGVSLEYVMLNHKVINKIIENKMMLYTWDWKKSLKHSQNIDRIFSAFEEEIKSGELPLYVINDFPEKAQQYIKL